MTELQLSAPECPAILADPDQRLAACHAADLFKVLGDPTRLQMLLLLNRSHHMAVCDLERRFNLQQPTISHHLRVLRQAGLIDCERRGLWAYYFILTPALGPLRTIIDELTLPYALAGP